ncbi:DUF2301 domain-containing membrane protein [Ancylothrix sp. C2]|uniref:DUF2301 domain-containing membrane protein n=1 Tax=Ancylothrix sp. D3o TaxID=2953691 RepID=UPI0021BAA771|nr:DUF2301 domain-containing membrane protein [Ancylothrix sp. D3o]MCT7952118.1 DUF2301 domain-containing membrane protein [Ancylothrix sp. D3o]
MTQIPLPEKVYQGQFGEFTITEADKAGVAVYRSGLMVAALCFVAGVSWVLLGGERGVVLDVLFVGFYGGLGVSLWTIHIYLEVLHRLLQVFWLVGGLTALVVKGRFEGPVVVAVYEHPLWLLGVGFVFAALTGIYFKEAFCFNRLETKVLTPLVPVLLLGHLLKVVPVEAEAVLLGIWGVLFLVFALRKVWQEMPDDIGDKSVFEYLHNGGSGG